MRAMIEDLGLAPSSITAREPAATLSPDFEQRFIDTWLAGIIKAGIETICATEPVGQDGAKAMFWSAVSKALSDHLRESAVFSYELDREMSGEELAKLCELRGGDLETYIPF